MMRLFCYIILCHTHLSVVAQTFTGAVKDSRGEVLSGASVIAIDSNKRTVAYCITDRNGKYALTVTKEKIPASVVVSVMGYEKKSFNSQNLRMIWK